MGRALPQPPLWVALGCRKSVKGPRESLSKSRGDGGRNRVGAERTQLCQLQQPTDSQALSSSLTTADPRHLSRVRFVVWSGQLSGVQGTPDALFRHGGLQDAP